MEFLYLVTTSAAQNHIFINIFIFNLAEDIRRIEHLPFFVFFNATSKPLINPNLTIIDILSQTD